MDHKVAIEESMKAFSRGEVETENIGSFGSLETVRERKITKSPFGCVDFVNGKIELRMRFCGLTFCFQFIL